MEQVSYYLLNEISIYPIVLVMPLYHSSGLVVFCSYRRNPEAAERNEEDLPILFLPEKDGKV